MLFLSIISEHHLGELSQSVIAHASASQQVARSIAGIIPTARGRFEIALSPEKLVLNEMVLVLEYDPVFG